MRWIVEAESIDDVVMGKYAICDTPLIECKDCKYYDTHECMGWDARYGLKDDDYCSWAERSLDA